MIIMRIFLLVSCVCIVNAIQSSQQLETKWRPITLVLGDPSGQTSLALKVSTAGIHALEKDAKGNNNCMELFPEKNLQFRSIDPPNEIKDLASGYTIRRCLMAENNDYCLAECMLPNGILAKIVCYAKGNAQGFVNLVEDFSALSLK